MELVLVCCKARLLRGTYNCLWKIGKFTLYFRSVIGQSYLDKRVFTLRPSPVIWERCGLEPNAEILLEDFACLEWSWSSVPLSCSRCTVSSSVSCWLGRFAILTRSTKRLASICPWLSPGACARTDRACHPLWHAVIPDAPQPCDSTQTCQPERHRRPWARWPLGRAWWCIT